jgi:ubiquinone/menaquinone biosynthesis C-methylase UbiE
MELAKIMLNKKQIKNFWDSQAQKTNITHESISNLEENPKLFKLKVDAEISKVMPRIQKSITQDSCLLDLGGGSGQWALRFSSLVQRITLVEFSEGMIDLARNAAKQSHVNNIEFIHSAAQNYQSPKKYDLIWISGLLIYLDDEDITTLLKNCHQMLESRGTILLRDGTGIGDSYNISNQYSESLKQHYSAFYRTADQYKELFSKNKFIHIDDEDMFEEGSPLNKWENTRLRLYQFTKQGNS